MVLEELQLAVHEPVEAKRHGKLNGSWKIREAPIHRPQDQHAERSCMVRRNEGIIFHTCDVLKNVGDRAVNVEKQSLT